MPLCHTEGHGPGTTKPRFPVVMSQKRKEGGGVSTSCGHHSQCGKAGIVRIHVVEEAHPDGGHSAAVRNTKILDEAVQALAIHFRACTASKPSAAQTLNIGNPAPSSSTHFPEP